METLVIKLPAVMDVEAARILKSEMLVPFYAGSSATLDVSDVERIGTPGLQLLWSAASTFERAGLALAITGASSAFTSAMTAAALPSSNTFHSDSGISDA